MHLLQVDKNSKILEIGDEIFKETVDFLKSLTQKRGGSFQYIDETGDIVVVDRDGEHIIPTKQDIQRLSRTDKSDFIDEEEAKRLLGV